MRDDEYYAELNNTKNYHLIFARLLEAARNQGIVTYQQLAVELGLRPQGNAMGKTLTKYLETIAVNEEEAGRPMLTALAVSVKGEPGYGFFWVAREFDKLDSEDSQDEEAFWNEEIRAVYEFWSQEFHI